MYEPEQLTEAEAQELVAAGRVIEAWGKKPRTGQRA
jgi:hypothetical protein